MLVKWEQEDPEVRALWSMMNSWVYAGFDETYAATRLGSVSKQKEKKRDWLVRLSMAQLILALLGVALLLTVSKAAPKTYEDLRVSFERIMSRDMSAGEVIQTLKKGAEKLQTPPTEEMSTFEEEQMRQTPFVEEASVSQGEETNPPPAEEASADQDGEEQQTPQPEETSEAIGGENSDNACFAPICATAEMVTPVEGTISSPFGYRIHPITKKYGIHNGVDIAAPTGTPIAAAFNGTVTEVGSNSVRGNYLVLSHGANTKTYYLHCSEILAEKGAVIRAGEIIAKVGETGWATGPHLHFSVAINDVYYNPEWLMP